MTSQELLKQAIAHHERGQLPQAEDLYRAILNQQPNHPDALELLGVLFHQRGQHEDGLYLIDQAIATSPHVGVYHNNRGEVLRTLNRLEEAVAAFRRAIDLKLQIPQSLSNLGLALEALGRYGEARLQFQNSLTIRPQHVQTWIALARVNLIEDYLEEAAHAARTALQHDPNAAEAHHLLGTTLRFAAPVLAEKHLRRAIELEPGHQEVFLHLAHALHEQARLADTIRVLQQAIRLDPSDRAAGDLLLFTLNETHEATPEQIAEQHRQWADKHTEHLSSPNITFPNSRNPNRRLRIGYVSPDFRTHSVARFLEPILQAHDPEQVEVFCYANVQKPDDVTERLKQLAHHWRDIHRMDVEPAVKMVRADKIDILIDLAGHTSGNCLLLFAHRPAPVQFTYLGYPNTTGMTAIQYRLTDSIADPPGQSDEFYTERLIRLPTTFLTYASPIGPEPAPRPKGPITFACYNRASKITTEVIEVWSHILKTLPESRLLLKGLSINEPEAREQRQAQFATHGIEPWRITFGALQLSHAGHLEEYHAIDVALDPFPYNGTTTTCEALWMGVPVVTFAGQTHASRVGASILTHVGLKELIARSPDEYVRIAVGLINDAPRLRDLRSNLRDRMKNSPLLNPIALTRAIEEAYRQAWTEWCGS
jgi:predicted O-linked N-acetylglucosamine transferase (SPINDLY family)